jgi:hypothetical protein
MSTLAATSVSHPQVQAPASASGPTATPDKEAMRLAALRKYDVIGSGPEEVFDTLTALAAQLCQVPATLISIVDATHLWLKSRYGCRPVSMGRCRATCSCARRQ